MIQVDINKAKEISHVKRRAARAAEFAPLDIEASIPAMSEQAEAQRQIIRDEFTVIQTKIDDAESVDQLKVIITQL